ncbi:uncharacterized protein [Cicer arietinum]|uniref:Uncharacterized protein LOC101490355 n=1 Tax=Cicer arietinum TaxID=3827 RepID=A0A1S2YZ77_CICAR|nr:uncharacterized protein LOC101490355 [Cicer arietinum]XP_004517213.1 uncharacterized protein LOC101490922 [Cicer arietinum]
METISKFPYTHQPLRSISFPTRGNPSSQRVQSLLNNLKQHHKHSLSSNFYSKTETIQSDLVLLAEMYNCMEEELFNSQQTQQALLHYKDGKLISQTLCGSVILLDACECSRDLLLILREHMQTLESSIRRRIRKGDSSIENSVSSYESFRKNAKKKISKQLLQLKRMQNKVNSFSLCDNQDQKLTFLATVLREANTITITILCSMLLFLSMPALGTKGSSLISKLKPMMLFSSLKEGNNNNGVGELNNVLCCLIGKEKSSDYNSEGQRALKLLERLNVDIDGLESGLDCMFRCLVKNRVLFLNMLAH